MIPAYYMANRDGIPRLKSTAVSVSTDAVTFSFTRHNFLGRPFIGLLIVALDQAIPAGTTTTLPVKFDSGGGAVAVTKAGGSAATAADITGEGVFLLFYDSTSRTLQLIPGIV